MVQARGETLRERLCPSPEFLSLNPLLLWQRPNEGRTGSRSGSGACSMSPLRRHRCLKPWKRRKPSTNRSGLWPPSIRTTASTPCSTNIRRESFGVPSASRVRRKPDPPLETVVAALSSSATTPDRVQVAPSVQTAESVRVDFTMRVPARSRCRGSVGTRDVGKVMRSKHTWRSLRRTPERQASPLAFLFLSGSPRRVRHRHTTRKETHDELRRQGLPTNRGGRTLARRERPHHPPHGEGWPPAEPARGALDPYPCERRPPGVRRGRRCRVAATGWQTFVVLRLEGVLRSSSVRITVQAAASHGAAQQ